jgi:type II secretory pathway component PulF
MNHDELAFVNLQLAGMLKSGIPLEGALRQLSSTMRRGKLRAEFEQLELDLGRGTPLAEALEARRVPDLYRQMVLVGAKGDNLPGVLILLADHYQRVSALGRRLKGLMIYPSIVLVASLGLSFFLALFFRALSQEMPRILNDVSPELVAGSGITLLLWLPVVVLGGAVLFGAGAAVVPPFRRWLRWHAPGFKEAGLAQLASVMRLMLNTGTNFGDALGLLRHLESKSPAGRDLAQWQTRLASGHGRFPGISTGSKVVPPLFSWLVSSADEDLAEGFRRAADVYQARAAHRIEMFLYAALPVSILSLGVMLVSQAYPVMRLFIQFGTILDQLGR